MLDQGGSLAAFFISTDFIHLLGTGTIDPILGLGLHNSGAM